jgi:hypothetical protein
LCAIKTKLWLKWADHPKSKKCEILLNDIKNI